MKLLFSCAVLAMGIVSTSAYAVADPQEDTTSVRVLTGIVTPPPNATANMDPTESYLRGLAVLDHFGAPAETDTQHLFDDLQGAISQAEIAQRIHLMDFHSLFQYFSRSDSTQLQIYQDRYALKVVDFTLQLSPTPSPERKDPEYRTHLLNALRNPPSKPLAGLRIALDPGHMGGDAWDDRTGKFVRDKKGRKLSEGVMALQISLLLEKSLTDLGAKVMITRYGLTSVSKLDYNTYDLHERGMLMFSRLRYEPWFQSLLATSAPGPQLYNAFSKSAQFKSLFSENMRTEYFAQGYDLDARVEAINSFNPDLTLIIHLDAGNVGSDPTGVNTKAHDGVKVYVTGAFFSDEVATRYDRALFGRHLLDTVTWGDSLKLARSVAHKIHDGLNIPYDIADPGNSFEVEPGVLARSLAVQRHLTSHPSAYVECMYYNDPNEFEALYKTTHPMTIDGQSHPYSDRLAQIADALQSAVVSFVKDYGQPPSPPSVIR